MTRVESIEDFGKLIDRCIAYGDAIVEGDADATDPFHDVDLKPTGAVQPLEANFSIFRTRELEEIFERYQAGELKNLATIQEDALTARNGSNGRQDFRRRLEERKVSALERSNQNMQRALAEVKKYGDSFWIKVGDLLVVAAKAVLDFFKQILSMIIKFFSDVLSCFSSTGYENCANTFYKTMKQAVLGALKAIFS
ncbi:MAG: hypothetical protein AAGN66_01225 [Acidobacteriota bacterium]